jgi:hypothetical protein
VYWRGQRGATWDLVSAFDRMAEARLAAAGQAREQEIQRLRGLRDRIRIDFRERLIGASEIRQSDLQAQPQYTWAIGRHFGLLTPVLDWSETPNVALFFAIRDFCRERRDQDGTVRLRGNDAVALFRLVNQPGVAEGGLNIERARIDGLPRLVAQRGAFTIMEGDFEFTCVAKHLAARGKDAALTKFVLTGGSQLLRALHDMSASGIDYRTLFPDQEGAALAANALAERIEVGD